MNCLTLLEKTSKLPIGHYGKKEAQEAVDNVYKACHEQARDLIKKHKIKKKYFEPQEAFDFCAEICNSLGHKQLNKIVLRSPDVSEFAAAHYKNKEIHFKYTAICISVLLHELTHHLCHKYYAEHGKLFLEMQELAYECAIENFKEILRDN